MEKEAREAREAERKAAAEAAIAAGEEAKSAEEQAAEWKLQEDEEIERVENTNDGKRQREEAKKQARHHRHRTWLMDLVRKMLGHRRYPAQALPRSRIGDNDDRASQLEEVVPQGADPAAGVKDVAFSSYERLKQEELMLRRVAREQDFSKYARLRADFQLSALWCARRYFTHGEDA